MIRMHQGVKRCSWIVGVMLLLCAFPAWTQTQSAASNAPAAAAPPPAPAMDAPLNVKAAQPPSTDDLAKGDPGGTMTGTVSDIPVADTKKGLTLADAVNQVGQNASRSTSSGRWSPASSSCSCRRVSPSSKPDCAARRTPTTP